MTVSAAQRHVVAFNDLAPTDFATAVTNARRELLDLLKSTINYAQAALPIDADAVTWS